VRHGALCAVVEKPKALRTEWKARTILLNGRLDGKKTSGHGKSDFSVAPFIEGLDA
jgi:hypothetical protein